MKDLPESMGVTHLDDLLPKRAPTLREVNRDLELTRRDITRCRDIAFNIAKFMEENGGEDRSQLKVDFLKWVVWKEQAQALEKKMLAYRDTLKK